MFSLVRGGFKAGTLGFHHLVIKALKSCSRAGSNLALNKATYAGGHATLNDGGAALPSNGVDGKKTGSGPSSYAYVSATDLPYQWWSVDLGAEAFVSGGWRCA